MYIKFIKDSLKRPLLWIGSSQLLVSGQSKLQPLLKSCASSFVNNIEEFAVRTSKWMKKPSAPKSSQPTRRFITKRRVVSTIFAWTTMYTIYHYSPSRTKISLVFQETSFNKKIVSKLSKLRDQHFYPCFPLTSPLLQSFVNNFVTDPDVTYVREIVKLPDGQIALDWANPLQKLDHPDIPFKNEYYPYEPEKERKILFILHGLTGGSESGYIRSLVDTAAKNGYRCVVMNQRGINQPMLTPKPYHAGSSEDIEYAIQYIKSKYPDAPMVACGLSMGGNQLFRYFGDVGENTHFLAYASVAMPFDVDACVDAIENTVYESALMGYYMKYNVLPHVDVLKKLEETHRVKIQDIFKSKGLRDYHAKFSVKVYGMKDSDEYFKSTLVKDHHIEGIKIPTLVLHAKDDPICVHHANPIEKLQQNPNIIYAETTHGAHLCWLTGILPTRWYAEPTVEFLDAVLQEKMKEKL